MIVLIGNADAIEGRRDPSADDPDAIVFSHAPGQRITEVKLPEGTSTAEGLATVTSLMGQHMAPEAKPHWIDCDAPDLKHALLGHYGLTSSQGVRPVGWGKPAPLAAIAETVATTLAVMWALVVVHALVLAIKTNGGVDLICRLLGDTSSNGTGSYAAANYIGVTANSTTPAASDTVLAGEITSGTLARAQAAYAHTNGTASYTLTKTFTSDQTVVLAKMGVFNAATSGTLVFESLLSSAASLVSGDTLTLTHTVTN